MVRRAIVILALGLSTGVAAAEDGFDRAAAALAAGSRAAERGDRTGLRAAALTLRATGALPVMGDDMVTRWLHDAHAVPPPAERDRALGPGYRLLQLGGGDAAIFEQTFLAGRRARVEVVPMHGADFSMQVSDGATALCHAAPERARCDWVPSYTTRFTIRIANPGPQPAYYFVMMQ